MNYYKSLQKNKGKIEVGKAYGSLRELYQLLGIKTVPHNNNFLKVLGLFGEYETNKVGRKTTITINKLFDEETTKTNITNYLEIMYVNVGKHERDLMDYPFANIPCEIKPRLGVYILELDGYVYIGKAEYRGFQGRCYSYQYDLKAGKGSNKGFDLLQRGAKLTWLFVLDEDMFYKRNYEQFGYKRTFTSLELIEMKLIALFKDVLGDKCVNHVIDEDVLNRYIYMHTYDYLSLEYSIEN